jgi:hypothetical protein
MRRKVFDAVVTTGEYEKNGQTKKQYRTVGAVLQDEDGRMSMKLDLLPTVGFNGWINFYEPKQQGEQKPKAETEDDFGDKDIPF